MHPNGLIQKVHSIKNQRVPGRPTEEKLKKVLNQQNDPTFIEEAAKSLSRMEVLKKLEVKRREELWCKALKLANFNKVLKCKEYVTVKELKAGTYNLKKVPKLALEVRSVETVGNCYQVILRDAHEDLIQASFHTTCRDYVVK